MKRFILSIIILLSAINNIMGQSTVIVSDDGALLYPTNFASANSLATESYVDEAIAAVDLSNIDVDFSDYYTITQTDTAISTAIAAIEIPSISGLATTSYVDSSIADITIPSIAGLATESYVDSSIAAIEIPSISGLATESYVDSSIAAIEIPSISGLATTSYVDSSIASIEIPSIAGLATESYVDSAVANIDTPELDVSDIESQLEEIQEELIPKSSLSVFIDLYRDGMDDSGGNVYSSAYVYASYYSDCILKVLDPDGNLLYFFSTVTYYTESLQSLHGSDIYDNNATVYYYPSGRNNDGTNGTTNLRAKTLFPSTAWSTHCIATYEESFSGQSVYNGITSVNDSKVRITAIQIYPSEEFHSIFLNPENTIVTNRQSISIAELDGKGSHLFRPAIIQYLR